MKNSRKETLKIWRIIDVINWGVDYFGKKDFDNPRLEIEIFLQHILNCEKIDLYIDFEKEFLPVNLKKLKEFMLFRSLLPNTNPCQELLNVTF